LLFSDMDKEFVNHAPHDERIKAIYHYLPKQLFRVVNEEKMMQHNFKKALEPEAPKIGPAVRMLVDYCKDRLEAGAVFSVPAAYLPPVGARPDGDDGDPPEGDLAMVPIGVAPPPPAFDEKKIVEDALLVASEVVPFEVRLGLGFKNHRFFRVVKTSVGARFLQHDDGYKSCRIAVSELVLGGKLEDAGLFGESTLRCSLQLDLFDAVKRVGTRELLRNMVVWTQEEHAMLKLTLPSAGNVRSRMLSLPACGDSEGFTNLVRSSTETSEWSTVVGQLLKVQGSDDPGGCYLDTLAGKLKSLDDQRSAPVDINLLMDLITSGVVIKGETEFGELTVRVNHQAVTWCSTAAVVKGTTNPVSHVRLAAPERHSKLALMMRLSSEGWMPMLGGPRGRHYAIGDAKLFDQSPAKAKLYFATLCIADRILEKLSVVETTLPLIYHGMPESYYRLLLRIKTQKDVQALLDMLDRSADPLALKDKAFAELLPPGDVRQAGNDDDDDVFPSNLPALLDLPGRAIVDPVAADIQRVHRIAASVLRAIPASMVDIRSSWSCLREGLRTTVHFDNASHSSGKQRAYIKCPVAWHAACFRYSIVEKHESHAHAAAWLAAWAQHALTQTQATFTKEDHKLYEPPNDVWRGVLTEFQEDPPRPP
jgi:hypothetical protein